MFEVGQEVVCVKKGRWRSDKTKESNSYGPKYLEDCIITGIRDSGYLMLQNHDFVWGGGFHPYNPKYFIPKSEITEIEVLSEVKSVMLPNVEELTLIGQ